MRRRIAGLMHRLAWWLDRRADDLWNIDDFLAPIYDISRPPPPPEEVAQGLKDALHEIWDDDVHRQARDERHAERLKCEELGIPYQCPRCGRGICVCCHTCEKPYCTWVHSGNL